MENNQLTIDEGTVTFWIPEKSIKFNDGQSVILANINPLGGSILIVKDDDNKLKVMFVVLGRGRVDIEYDVSELDNQKKHMVAFTWGLKQHEIKLYLDGKLLGSKENIFN
jgi:hypothetical protein